MIPALLSCIFVLYLYRTLNAPDVEESVTAPPCGSNEASGLEQRLDALRQRIERLASSAGKGGQS